MTNDPLISDESGSSGSGEPTSGGGAATDGPSISLTMSDGEAVRLDSDDLLVYCSLLQTALFVVLVWMEARR